MKLKVFQKLSEQLNNKKGDFKMNRIFSVNFWLQTFISTLITMFMIYLIKKMAGAVNIPVVSEVASAV